MRSRKLQRGANDAQLGVEKLFAGLAANWRRLIREVAESIVKVLCGPAVVPPRRTVIAHVAPCRFPWPLDNERIA